MHPVQKANARLVLSVDGSRSTVSIDALPFTIGRGVGRDLILHHPQISREHARIERDADGYLLRDMGSRHGTFVNGIAVTITRLRSGDFITLGTSHDTLRFEEGEEESTARTLLSQLSQSGASTGDQNDLEKLSLFLKAAQSLNTYGAVHDVLRSMLEYTLRLTGAERGFVFLGDSADSLRLECGQDREGTDIPGHPAISYSIVRDAVSSQLEFILSDLTGKIVEGRDSIILNAIRSVVAIPLHGQNSGRLLGVLYLDSHSGSGDFTRTGNDILHAIAHQAATLVENLRMLETEREAALLRRELDIAAAIQRQIIPQALPEFSFAHLSARTVPCTSVGGDFYDVITTADGFVAVIADVCGKGVPAALLASMVQGMFHAQVGMQATTDFSLVDMVQSINTFVCSRTPGEKYLTLVALRYIHSGSGEAQIELINGGHICPFVVRANGVVEIVREGDLPVGLMDFAHFHSVPVNLEVGDRMILLSDGITEAENCDGAQFGPAQLEDYLHEQNAVAALFAALDTFCQGTGQQDDQTILTIQRTA
ncbi:SpoIIE family protein phosphatase [Paracidobacterium acidisoli]|uniref:FHA domain-containing protein n=1 Tax=Paracidobacterium acidisoli TaxID=2303751 RepID=A0A372ILI3_9BACT|nr:SpoIIE family protein phosphatase [Paracidobacterium acidisoli]MBT9332391.1 SpoIIE family protein phosphatase [Paracidobacterium acidisoli]